MVSPFMSFATGALQAVDKNIDRWREAEAAEKEREDAAAQRMKELEFQRDTTYEVEKRRKESAYDLEELKQKGVQQKTQRKIGGFTWGRYDKKPDLEAQDFFSQAESNPEAFKTALEDSRTRNQIISAAFKHFGTMRRGVGIYSMQNRFGKLYEGNVPLGHIPSQLRAISKITNPDILKLGDLFHNNPGFQRGNNPDEQTPPDKNAVLSRMEGGTVKDYNLDGIENLPAALNAFKRINLGYDRMGDDLLKQKFMEKVIGNFGSTKLDNTRVQRIVNAAANPDVMNYISGSTQPSKEQQEGAIAFFQNPDNGFINDETGIIDAENFVNFVNLFGLQKAGSAFTGAEAQEQKFSAINKGRIAKELAATNEVGLAAESASTTIKEMLRMIDEGVTVGGDVQKLLTRAPFEVGAFVRDVGRITQTLTQTDRGYGAGKILGADGTKQDAISKKAIGRLNKANERLQSAEQAFSKEDSIVKKRALAAAQLDMLELVLAYQITGILQGGTGGRTISDADITRALKMFSTRFGDVDGRKKKLAFVQKLVTSSINKKKVFAILNNTSINADMYISVKRGAKLLNLGVNQNNVYTKAAESAGEQEDLSNAQDIYRQVIPIAGDNYNQTTYAAGISNVIRKDGQGQLVNNLVINSDDLALWKNAAARFRENGNSEQLGLAKQKIVERGGTIAFDAATGKEVPITWTIKSGKAGFDTGKSVRTPNTTNIMGSVPRRIDNVPSDKPVPVAPQGDDEIAANVKLIQELGGTEGGPAEGTEIMRQAMQIKDPEKQMEAVKRLWTPPAGGYNTPPNFDFSNRE